MIMKNIISFLFCLTIKFVCAQDISLYNDFIFNMERSDLCEYIDIYDTNYIEKSLDSILCYNVTNLIKERDKMFKMKNLVKISFNEGFLRKARNNFIIKNPIEIPASVRYAYFWSSVPISIQYNLHQNKDKLEVLFFSDIYFDKNQNIMKNNRFYLDFSYLESLKEFTCHFTNLTDQNIKIELILPHNLISFSGDVDSNFTIKSFPKSIEHIEISFGDTFPNDFFRLSELKVLYIDNYIPITKDFLNFKKIQKLKVTHLTTADIGIIKQMSSLDTLYFEPNLDCNFNSHNDLLIPIEIKNLTVKCMVLKSYSNNCNLEQYAKKIKRFLPMTKVFYIDRQGKMFEINE